jgi:hypothetical protein
LSRNEATAHHHDMPAMAGMNEHARHHTAHDGIAAWTGHWVLMVVAMMWPLYGIAAAAIAAASYRRWQVITAATFLGVMSGLWVIVGWFARVVYCLVHPPPVWWTVGWLMAAIAATRSLWRSRALQRCVRVSVLAPSGRQAILTAAHTAARQWPRCLLLCGPVMVAMVGTHELVVMAGGSAAIWWEQRHPRSFREPVSAGILLGTVVMVLIATASGILV